MDYPKSLEEKLGNGLYIENLKDLISLCNEAINVEQNVLAFYTLQNIFIGVKSSFDERALPTDEFEFVQSKLLDPILATLTILKNDHPTEEIFDSLTDLVGIYSHLSDDYF